jgi:hypothetical protein
MYRYGDFNGSHKQPRRLFGIEPEESKGDAGNTVFRFPVGCWHILMPHNMVTTVHSRTHFLTDKTPVIY